MRPYHPVAGGLNNATGEAVSAQMQESPPPAASVALFVNRLRYQASANREDLTPDPVVLDLSTEGQDANGPELLQRIALQRQIERYRSMLQTGST